VELGLVNTQIRYLSRWASRILALVLHAEARALSRWGTRPSTRC